jgi:hypothetical protein
VLGAAALLALTAWCWAGRSPRARWWVGRQLGTQLVLAVAPGLGLLILGGGLLALFGTSAALLVAPLMLAGLVLELAGMLALLPGWWGPGWYRRLPRCRRPAGR